MIKICLKNSIHRLAYFHKDLRKKYKKFSLEREIPTYKKDSRFSLKQNRFLQIKTCKRVLFKKKGFMRGVHVSSIVN